MSPWFMIVVFIELFVIILVLYFIDRRISRDIRDIELKARKQIEAIVSEGDRRLEEIRRGRYVKIEEMLNP